MTDTQHTEAASRQVIDAPISAPPAPALKAQAPRNPYALGLWILTGAMFLTAFVLRQLGPEMAWIPNGIGDFASSTFDPTVLANYNIAAFVFLVLGIVCLLTTLVFHAARWKPAAS